MSEQDDCEGCEVHNLFCEKGTQKLHGFQTAGHFAQYSSTDHRNAMVLPDGMDMITAAPLFCAGVTGTCLVAASGAVRVGMRDKSKDSILTKPH